MAFPAAGARRVLDSLDEEIAVIDPAGTIVYVNAAWVAFGRANGLPERIRWIGVNYLDACRTAEAAGDDTAAAAVRGFQDVLAGRIAHFQHEYPCFGPDEERWFLMRVCGVRDTVPPLFVVSHHNITQRKLAERRVEALSLVDALTGLANRRRLDGGLHDEWHRCMRAHSPISLLMLDIDHFKAYNDALGHLAGDRCLAGVARALLGYARRPGDLAARFGGEEFAVVLGGTELREALHVAGAIADAVGRLGLWHADGRPLTVSIGVATDVPVQGHEPLELLQRADTALYRAKRQGRNRIVAEEAATSPVTSSVT